MVNWDDCMFNVDVFVIYMLDVDGKIIELCM